MQIAFPFHIDGQGRSASAGDDAHIRDLVEQVLFTVPGERVNRSTFGSGLLQLIFAPSSDELATATQFLVQGSLQQWLGTLIQVQAVDVSSDDAIVTVTVRYMVRSTQQQQVATFTNGM